MNNLVNHPILQELPDNDLLVPVCTVGVLAVSAGFLSKVTLFLQGNTVLVAYQIFSLVNIEGNDASVNLYGEMTKDFGTCDGFATDHSALFVVACLDVLLRRKLPSRTPHPPPHTLYIS